MVVLSILGPPGAGKSTLAHQVCRLFQLTHFSSGDFIRHMSEQNTFQGCQIREYVRMGIPVPDELIIDSVLDTLVVRGGNVHSVLLDGFPRTIKQANMLDATLLSSFDRVSQVIYLNIPAELAHARLAHRRVCDICSRIFTDAILPEASSCPSCGGRLVRRWGDDDDWILQKRRQAFYEDTSSVLQHYAAKGGLTELDGSRSPEQLIATLVPILQEKCSMPPR